MFSVQGFIFGQIFDFVLLFLSKNGTNFVSNLAEVHPAEATYCLNTVFKYYSTRTPEFPDKKCIIKLLTTNNLSVINQLY